MTDKVWFTPAEAAPLLGYRARSTIITMIHAGEIKARRRGNRYMIPRSEIERMGTAPEPAA